MISTGTLTGMLRAKAGETDGADFGPYGSVAASDARCQRSTDVGRTSDR
jgi:2-keto-4-pentenoate hydratase